METRSIVLIYDNIKIIFFFCSSERNKWAYCCHEKT